MRQEVLLTAFEAARNAGSFTLKFIFTLEAEIFNIRAFVSAFGHISNGNRINIDDETMMRLRIVAVKRKWQNDTDRAVIITTCDDFDINEILAKLVPVMDGIEAVEVVPREFLQDKCEKHEGTMDPKKAIRHAQARGEQELKIIIPSATHTDAVLLMDLRSRNFIYFVNRNEELVFLEAQRNQTWALGGNLSATIFIKKELPVHAAEGVMHGAHVRVKTAKIEWKH
jgi:hypothetical protein